ncbi:MAG TPA: 4Fe-4S dicluster domain-containing protein [Lacipirellulaceae bacterium]|nr:4Fe-4S dicluster domain-containing protein [Lacipirellulaceae bacterium]
MPPGSRILHPFQMVDLFCTPFVDLIQRMRLEFRNQQSIFDLPVRKWYLPTADAAAPDLSVRFHDQVAGNASGPASGPQTQMAQNIVLSWLAGGRIMELKTVQVNDELKISRPCIDAANVGYNVEWSQELHVADSLEQYVAGAMLIHMLRHAPYAFGNPFGDTSMAGTSGELIYDMSIGYDLAGIRTPKVVDFIRGMINARESVERLREQIPRWLGRLRDLDYPFKLSRSITLSTFHGCPADEIERICEFLLTELDVNVIVKMNPPMLGRERLEHLLYDLMGYHELRVNQKAYTSGLQFNESLEICSRLSRLAASRNLHFGAKFSNTLEVENHRDFFQPTEKIMYLSGAPLHVITLTLANEFRQAMGADFPISFSAGVDRKNFSNLVACGLVPITTCTDLLKTGGYGRLPPYLHDLRMHMERIGARTIDEFILDYRGQRPAANNDPVHAGFLNMPLIVAETQADPRYRAAQNRAVPKKIDSHLVTFDCITCDKCIPVCPNDANFSYHTGDVRLAYRDVEIRPDGSVVPVGDEKVFELQKADQIANFADYCNQCGNCDTFCPEYDGPYLKKPNFFGSRSAFEAGAPHDGFLLQQSPEGTILFGRITERIYRLVQLTNGNGYRYHDGIACVCVSPDGRIALDTNESLARAPHVLDVGRFHALATLLRGITDSTRVHAVNTPMLADRQL